MSTAIFDFLPEMASNFMVRADSLKLGEFLRTAFLRPRTARMEVAPRGWIDGAGHIAGKDDSLPLLLKIWIRQWDGRK